MKLLVLTLMLFSFGAQANIVARVIDVQGNAFSFSGKQSKSLKYGSKIWDLSEVMVEDGSTLSLSSTDGYVIHVNGGSLVKFFKGNVELKNGYVWVNNPNKVPATVSSANSMADFTEGQFIFSYDNISGKSQLLVLTGDVKFANTLEPNLKINVPAGHFSLVDKEYEKGLPRAATFVGKQSYKQMKHVFANFTKLKESVLDDMLESKPPSKASRNIASVDDQFGKVAPKQIRRHSTQKGKVIFVRTFSTRKRTPASASPMKYYMDVKNREAKKKMPAQTGKFAPVNYWGKTWQAPLKTEMAKTNKLKINTSGVQRVPASVKPIRKPASLNKSNLINELKRSEFEKSYDKEAPKIKRHSNEVNQLIDELKSFNQDYQKKY